MAVEGVVKKEMRAKTLKTGEVVNYVMHQYVEGNKTPHQMIFFDNISDMVECVSENRDNKSWDDRNHPISDDGGHWTFGDDFPDVQKTFDALMMGVIPTELIERIDKVKFDLYDKHPELFELEASASKLKRKRIFSQDGDELNIDRYMSGDLDMWQEMTRRPQKQSIKLMINACLHCGHDAKEFQEGMIMVTAFLDILDKAGISSEVWYAPVSQGSASGVDLAGVFSRIKGPEEVLDICKMLSCGAPGLFRYYTFKVWCNLLEGRMSGGLGMMVTDKSRLKLVRDMNEFDVMVNANDSPTETFNIISQTIKDLF